MIADLSFGPPNAAGVRQAHFIPRASIPVAAACLVANNLRETLRDVLGERCEVAIGEPAAIDPSVWASLTRDAHCFLTPGRQTDIVLVVSQAQARSLVLCAFGEGSSAGPAPLSALELQAVERIAARCAAAFDPLCAERRGPSVRVAAGALPVCVAYFDVRVRVPIAIEIGIAIVRELPDPGPSQRFPAALLGPVEIEVHAEFAAGTMDVATLLRLVPGDVIPLATKVGSAASLKLGNREFAYGIGGANGGRYSLQVQSVQHSMGVRA